MTKISGPEGLYGDLAGLHNPELEQLLEEREALKSRDFSAIPWVLGAVTLGAVSGKLGWSAGRRWHVRHA